MSDLSRDARALVARARRRDGASAEDRARLRHQLEVAWARQRADVASGAGPVARAPVSARVLQSMAAAMMIVSLGFLSPEAPRMLERAARQASRGFASPPLGVHDTRAVDPLAAQDTAALGAAPESTAAARTEPPADDARVIGGAERHASVPKRLPAAHAARRAHRRSAEQVAPPEPSSPPPLAASTPPLAPAFEPSPPAGKVERAPEPEPSSGARAASPRERSAETASSGDVGPTVSDRSFAPQAIDDELAWLGAAQEALRLGQPSRALSLVQQHAFRFPRGALAPERGAVQALALCALERKQAARAVLADLARRTPSSPLVDRVRRSCGL